MPKWHMDALRRVSAEGAEPDLRSETGKVPMTWGVPRRGKCRAPPAGCQVGCWERRPGRERISPARPAGTHLSLGPQASRLPWGRSPHVPRTWRSEPSWRTPLVTTTWPHTAALTVPRTCPKGPGSRDTGRPMSPGRLPKQWTSHVPHLGLVFDPRRGKCQATSGSRASSSRPWDARARPPDGDHDRPAAGPPQGDPAPREGARHLGRGQHLGRRGRGVSEPRRPPLREVADLDAEPIWKSRWTCTARYCRLFPAQERQRMPDTRADGRCWRRGPNGVLGRVARDLCQRPRTTRGWWKCFAGGVNGARSGGSRRDDMARQPRPITRGLPGSASGRGDMARGRDDMARIPRPLLQWPRSASQG